MILMLAMAMAMQAAAVVTPPAPCSVEDVRPADAPSGGAGLLVAGCGTHGAVLGAASRYSSTWSPVANGLLVVRVRGTRTEVLLVSPAARGAGLVVNDVTRELARLAGRSPDLGLGSAAVDTTRYAVDGSVGAIAAGGTRWLDLKPYALRAAQPALPAATNGG